MNPKTRKFLEYRCEGRGNISFGSEDIESIREAMLDIDLLDEMNRHAAEWILECGEYFESCDCTQCVKIRPFITKYKNKKGYIDGQQPA